MGSLNDDVGAAYAKHTLDCDRVSHLVTQAAMYYEVASDTWLENERSESEFKSGIIDKDNKLYLGKSSEYTQLYPKDLKIGHEFYEIKNEAKITGKSTKKNFAMPDERHFVTDQGVVFVLPGFYYEKEDEENRWYINGRVYYINGNFNFADLPEESSGEILKPEKYEVKYDLNGGVGVIGTQEKIHGKPLKLSDVIPKKEGFKFKGWATAINALNPEYIVGGEYLKDESVTLYALWENKIPILLSPGKSATVWKNTGVLREDIKTVKIIDLSTTSAPNNYLDKWDVSAKNDESVIAWISVNSANHSKFDMTVGAYGKIKLSPNSECLFDSFTSCERIEGLTNLDTEDVTNMRNMFAFCHLLQQIDVSAFKTEKVTTMENMFFECHALKSIDLNHFSGAKLLNTIRMFFECTSLKTIEMDNFATPVVTDIGVMFGGCENIVTINARKLNTSNVSNVGELFSGCKSLKTINIDVFDASNVKDMNRLFANCESLEDLEIGKFVTDKAIRMDGMFLNCKSLSTIDLSFFNTSNVKNMSLMFSGVNVSSFDFSSFDTRNVTNMSAMFKDCTAITHLDLSYFKTPELVDMSKMFEGCLNLKTVNLSGFDTSKVTLMSSTFKNCKSLTSLNLNHFNTPELVDIQYMFYQCVSLNELHVDNFVTSNVICMDSTFRYCTSLISLNLNSFRTNNVDKMRYFLSDCASLEELDIRNFDLTNVSDFGAMFMNNVKLKTVDIGVFNSSASINLGELFRNCYSLEEIDLSSFNTSQVTNFNNLFNGCKKLKVIDVRTFDTRLATRMEGFFKECTAVETIYLGDNFNDLSGEWQLTSCSALKSIVSTYDGVMKISSKLGVNRNAILYVPEHLVEEYKANSTYANLFKERIKPISEFVEN